MSTICRTCLQKSTKTYKTHQPLGDFGGGEVKISIILRFCMPELYLGLSTNPEICYDCTESLKVVYLFKKKCLDTENIIGNFLKNVRCTARSVDLHDVLAYLEEQSKLQSVVKNSAADAMLSSAIAEDIISEWEDVPDEAVDKDNVVLEVQQSAPNPENFQYDKNKLKFCHETGLFFDQQGQYFDCSGYPVDRNTVVKDHNETQVTNNENPNFVQYTESSDNLCKITSVFSLSESTETANRDSVNAADDANDANNVNNTNDDMVNIKEEPLDIETNGDLNYSQSDEETLDASETASYEDMQCTSSLQGIIDNLPEINDTNQYVDIPEFVHINNFGLKELEELRRQQQEDAKTADKNIVLNFKNKISSASDSVKPPSETLNLSEKEPIAKELRKEETFTKVPLSTLPETLFINGKRMVKCAEGYRVMEVPSMGPVKILSPLKKIVNRMDNATQVDSVPTATIYKPVESAALSPVGRKRKKIKIVPVAENKFRLFSSKGAKLSPKLKEPSKYKKIKLIPKVEDKDVVVLFTNYTYDGEYINDHDYLINPYKRNKILFEENDEWFCMCYICNCKHHVYEHVPHMKTHVSKCKICLVDLGTPYMLNVHVKSHTKPCRQCTERVPYGQMESHEEQHFKDELEYDRVTKKKGHHLMKNRRKRVKKFELVPLPVETLEHETISDESKKPEELEKISSLVDIKTEDESSNEEEWSKTGTSSKKPKRRRRKMTKSEVEIAVERSSRVLRSNARKSYSETESEEKISTDLKSSSSL